MSDYQELYLKLFRASSQAIELLSKAQQECEDLYCSTTEPELRVLDFTNENQPDT